MCNHTCLLYYLAWVSSSLGFAWSLRWKMLSILFNGQTTLGTRFSRGNQTFTKLRAIIFTQLRALRKWSPVLERGGAYRQCYVYLRQTELFYTLPSCLCHLWKIDTWLASPFVHSWITKRCNTGGLDPLI